MSTEPKQTKDTVEVASSALLEPKPWLFVYALPGHEPERKIQRPRNRRTSSQKVRNDPRREKTPEDLARIAAASERRARREAARKGHANQTKGSNVKVWHGGENGYQSEAKEGRCPPLPLPLCSFSSSSGEELS